MLTGARPSITGRIGHPRIPTPNTAAAATAIEAGLGDPRAILRSPVAQVRPHPAAPPPASPGMEVAVTAGPAIDRSDRQNDRERSAEQPQRRQDGARAAAEPTPDQ